MEGALTLTTWAFATIAGISIFSGTLRRKQVGEIIDDYIDEATQAEYGLGDDLFTLRSRIRRGRPFSVQDLRDFPGDDDTPIKQWEAAPYLIDSDLMNVFAILEQMHRLRT